MRIGHGIDAHRLVPGRPLVLGGVRIPFDQGLEGHSDGDAVTHAVADAVLGAAGLGDLGRHFPSSDARLEGVDSIVLLAEAARMAREQGFAVENAHVVAIAERPRLGPHLGAMAQRLADALDVAADCVAVAATTTDGLGFAGRAEGIAATAVVLLRPLS